MPAKGKPKLPRKNGKYLHLFNSGLEVWLYDEANLKKIAASGAMNFGKKGQKAKYKSLAKQGAIVGYSLYQDDEVAVAVYVGSPLSGKELAVSRWLEVQHALLDLPSGKLCIEPNDSCRVLPDNEPTDKGGRVEVPPGKYRLALYRIDHEALGREGLSWNGPQEVIVLTPGGKPGDAAETLLPFEPRRDTSWIGKYRITGKKAEALACFMDYWDTFLVNLDAAAVRKLKLKPGAYLQTRVPELGITLVSVYGRSWDEAQKFPRPQLPQLDEYGYASLSPMADWNGAQALFCRREKTKSIAEDKHHHLWLPATVEVLNAAPRERKSIDGGVFSSIDLAELDHCDSNFLAVVLDGVLAGIRGLGELPWADALKRLDEEFQNAGFKAAGDINWQTTYENESIAYDIRLYTGAPDTFGAILAREMSIEIVLLSERAGGEWIVTGLADTLESVLAAQKGLGRDVARVQLENRDDAFKDLYAAHAKKVKAAKSKPAPAASDAPAAQTALARFLASVFV